MALVAGRGDDVVGNPQRPAPRLEGQVLAEGALDGPLRAQTAEAHLTSA